MKLKFFLIPLLLTVSACSSYSYLSQATQGKINIDGKIDEWEGKLKFIKEAQSAIGIANDLDNLYLAFTTTNKSNINKIMRAGFIVWFEPENGKTIGIQYPFRSQVDRADLRQDPRRQQNTQLKQFKTFRIVNEDMFPLATYNIPETKNINLAMSIKNSHLNYEIKIPLNGTKDNYKALQVHPGQTLKISFETVPFERRRELNPGNMRIGSTDRKRGAMGKRNNTPRDLTLIDTDIDFSVEVELSK